LHQGNVDLRADGRRPYHGFHPQSVGSVGGKLRMTGIGWHVEPYDSEFNVIESSLN
jgi:hypothetical protein